MTKTNKDNKNELQEEYWSIYDKQFWTDAREQIKNAPKPCMWVKKLKRGVFRGR